MKKLLTLVFLLFALPVFAWNLTDPGADRVIGWDESENDTIWFSMGTGLTTSGTEIVVSSPLSIYYGITPSANVQSFLGAADYSAMRTLLSLVPGTNVQAYDADLTTYAGITPSADVQVFLAIADQAVRNTLATSLTAEPTSTDLVTQGFYWADNSSWDPCSVSGTDPYYVFWSGSAWVCMHDKDGDLFIGSISEDIPIADADGTGSFKFAFDFDDVYTGTISETGDFTFGTWGSSTGLWKTVFVHPSAFKTDGTLCGAVTSAQVNSGPYVFYTACSDGAGSIYFQFQMPENWDGDDIYFEPLVYSAEGAPSGTIEFEVAIQARSNDAVINNTWVTTDGNVYFEDAETTATTVDTQYKLFRAKNKTAMSAGGAGGDIFFGRLVRDNDDATHDTSTQAIRVMGVTIYYKADKLSEKD